MIAARLCTSILPNDLRRSKSHCFWIEILRFDTLYVGPSANKRRVGTHPEYTSAFLTDSLYSDPSRPLGLFGLPDACHNISNIDLREPK